MDWAKQRRDEVIHVVVCAQKTESSILCNRRLWTWQRESGELCVFCGIIYKGVNFFHVHEVGGALLVCSSFAV